MAKMLYTTWQELEEQFNTKGRVHCCNNTHAHRLDSSRIFIFLHDKAIITLMSNNVVAIRTMGWATATTFDRFRQVVPAGWRTSRKGGCPLATFNGKSTPIESYEWLLLHGSGAFKYTTLNDRHRIPALEAPSGVASGR